MNRLQSELHRLYHSRSPAQADATRALAIELTRPPSWELLSIVWHGVQAELDLPAPSIAVSGTDGLQLRFAFAQPVDAVSAHAFLDGLRARFLTEVDPLRVRLLPATGATLPTIPALQEPSGNWSAFVAPDLAPVFGDTPWLDIPPNEEGQAALLRGLETIAPEAFDAALVKLAACAAPPLATTGDRPSKAPATDDPRQFLLRVMNDESVALALRIEAAKALLMQRAG